MEVRGKVIRGQGLAGLGFGLPTANLRLEQPLYAEPGVYAAICWVGIVKFNAVVYIGPLANEKFEVHIFDFRGDLYDRRLDVTLLEKISDHVPWENEEQMRKKIQQDVERARAYFSTAQVALAKSLGEL